MRAVDNAEVIRLKGDERMAEVLRRAVYAGKTTLVVGSGYSAATTVCSLAALAEEQLETWVIWVARGAST